MLVTQDRDNFWMLNWLDQYMEGHKGFICGGCFKNIFNKEKVKDLDIFFKCRQDFEDAVQYFDSKTKGYIDLEEYDEYSDGLSEEDAEYIFYYENKNVKAYKHKKTGVAIELCCKIFGTAEEILNKFDFTVVKFAYYKEEVPDEELSPDDILELNEMGIEVNESAHIEYKIIHDDKFFEHLHLKRLVLDNEIPFPMSTLERMLRYAKYGYFPCRETKMKIVQALRDLPDELVLLSESLYDGMD